jgi:hypothetical protein
LTERAPIYSPAEKWVLVKRWIETERERLSQEKINKEMGDGDCQR